jgi:hypothetical protein
MKKAAPENLVNRITVLLLLLGSAFYHVQEGIKAKKESINDKPFNSAAQSIIGKTSRPVSSFVHSWLLIRKFDQL